MQGIEKQLIRKLDSSYKLDYDVITTSDICAMSSTTELSTTRLVSFIKEMSGLVVIYSNNTALLSYNLDSSFFILNFQPFKIHRYEILYIFTYKSSASFEHTPKGLCSKIITDKYVILCAVPQSCANMMS